MKKTCPLAYLTPNIRHYFIRNFELNSIGLPSNIAMNEFDKHVRTLLLMGPIIFSERLDVMVHMFLSQGGGGFKWNEDGILLSNTDISPEAELLYREKFFEDIDEMERLTTQRASRTSSLFECGENYYTLERAKRNFNLVNIDLIATTSPPTLNLNMKADRLIDSYCRDGWNCLNIPDNANIHYRKAALEMIARVMVTLNDHRDTEMYSEITDVLKAQAEQNSNPKM